MKKYFILFFMIFLFNDFSHSLELKPKLFFDMEHGERYLTIEDEFSDYDFNIDKSYSYNSFKFGYKQKINSTSIVSAIFKRSEQDYSYSRDKDLNNSWQSLIFYYKKNINKVVELKFESNIKKINYDEVISADKENLWYKTGFSLKLKPTSTNFFTSKKNIYYFTYSYKNRDYDNASEKNSYSNSIISKWVRKISPAVRFITRGKYNVRKYDVESGQRQNSDKYSVGCRIEYDFNK